MTDVLNLDLATLEKWAEIEPEQAFEAICSAGRTESADADEKAWNLGDLACLVNKAYGANRIKKFANEVGASVSIVKQCRRMSAVFPKDTRYLFPNLSRSHYREALPLRALGAAIMLQMAADNGWVVEQVKREKAKVLGKAYTKDKLLDATGCVERANPYTGQVVIQLDPGLDGFDLLALENVAVEVKLYRKVAA